MKKSQKGFTIIEVALVLAIGALIFLVVFLAVPALQRNQRNDARKRDISNVVQSVADYNANNPTIPLTDGQVYNADGPIKATGSTTSATPKLGNFLDQLSNNTDNVTVVVDKASMGTDLPLKAESTSKIYVVTRRKCKPTTNSDGSLEKGSSRQSAVVGVVEVGGSNYQWYCSDAS